MWASGLITWWECEETANFLHQNILLLLGPQQGRIHETWWEMQLYSWPLAIGLNEYLVQIVFPCPWIKVPAGPRSWMVTLSYKCFLIPAIRNSVSYIDHNFSCDVVSTLAPSPSSDLFQAGSHSGRWTWLISLLHLAPPFPPPSPAPSCCSGSVLSRVGAAW